MIALKINTLIITIFVVLLTVIYLPFQAQAVEHQPSDTLLQQLILVDKELNTAFKEALNRLDEKGQQAIRKEQNAWIKERDKKCGSVFKSKDMDGWLRNLAAKEESGRCVIILNMDRTHKLETKYFNASLFCKNVAKMIKDGTLDKFVVDSRNYEPRGSEYINLDIDGDGKPDKVTVESASEGSFVQVKLSGGVEYVFETSGFTQLIKLRNQIYALVTHWDRNEKSYNSPFDKISHRSLHLLNNQEPKKTYVANYKEITMAINYKNYTEEEYTNAVVELISRVEGHLGQTRDIGDGKATIGYGYTFNRSNNVALWTAAGITLSPAELRALQQIDSAPANQQTSIALNSFTRTVTADEARALLGQTYSKYEGPANSLNMPFSPEKAVFVSVTYNRGVTRVQNAMGAFYKAIQAGDRAEAWYQIRYNSLGNIDQFANGKAKRRYLESQVFGLYDNPAQITLQESLSAYKMFQRHREEIYDYESTYGEQFDFNNGVRNMITEGNNDSGFQHVLNSFGLAQIETINEALSPSRAVLFADLRQRYPELANRLIADDTNYRSVNIYLNPAKATDVNRGSRMDARYYEIGNQAATGTNDVMIGMDQRDVLFGGKGSDALIGESGNDALYGGDDDDVLVGGTDNDWLDGGDQKDWLYGGDGEDKLTGGKGDDVLYGGAGNDTYLYTVGDGNDTIIDSQGDDKIIIFDQNGEPIRIGDVYRVGNTNVWKDASGEIQITHNSPWQIVLEDGSTIQLGEDFQDGDFGINLSDALTTPTTTQTIVGDLTPIDYNAGQSGVQMQLDALGNVKCSSVAMPGRSDFLNDGAGNDRVEGKDGNDFIYQGTGDDWILGGNGRDGIGYKHGEASGNDIIEGGSGGDSLYGGDGDDQIFGENYGEMATLVNAGEIAQSINEQGDIVGGGTGDDYLYGGDRNDALFGGEGEDLIVGGGGDDCIFSGGDYDGQYYYSDQVNGEYSYTSGEVFNWSFTNGYSNASYQPVFTNLNYFSAGETDTSDDVVYAGTGNDFVYAAGGNDEVDAGDGDNVIFGWSGNDQLFGDNYAASTRWRCVA